MKVAVVSRSGKEIIKRGIELKDSVWTLWYRGCQGAWWWSCTRYDYQAGFWGAMGYQCLGMIPPFIEEFNYPIPKNCSGGYTGVFVNGRELHQQGLDLLFDRGLPITRDKSYLVHISGRVFDEASGEELENLGELAPTACCGSLCGSMKHCDQQLSKLHKKRENHTEISLFRQDCLCQWERTSTFLNQSHVIRQLLTWTGERVALLLGSGKLENPLWLFSAEKSEKTANWAWICARSILVRVSLTRVLKPNHSSAQAYVSRVCHSTDASNDDYIGKSTFMNLGVAFNSDQGRRPRSSSRQERLEEINPSLKPKNPMFYLHFLRAPSQLQAVT